MSASKLRFFVPTPLHRELRLLSEIERNPSSSQKELARKVGLAPSMVNNYVKQLGEQEKIQKRGLNNKSTTYHLTDAGRSLLERLVSQYVAEVLGLYVRLTVDLHAMHQNGISRVVLHGAAEACETVRHAAEELGLEIVQPRSTACGAVPEGPAEPVQAVLLASADSLETAAIEGLKRPGITVYRV